MAINILLYVLIGFRLWIGVVLFLSARKNRLPNLYWLALLFLNAVVTLPFAPSPGNPLGNLPVVSLWLFGISPVIGTALLIAFVHQTFYAGKKSPVGGMLAAYAVLALISLYGVAVSVSNYQQSPLVAAANLINLIVWVWHSWVAWQAYQGVVAERQVEDWVKARYGLMVAYAVIIILGAVTNIIRIVFAGGAASTALGSITSLVSLVTQILSVVLQFLVWVMPEGFRRWLNRNYKPAVAAAPEMSEEELMKSLMQGKS